MTMTGASLTNPGGCRVVIRVGDAAFARWDGLTSWLEADPRHLIACNMALDDAALAPLPGVRIIRHGKVG